jgi:hypothetical protein
MFQHNQRSFSFFISQLLQLALLITRPIPEQFLIFKVILMFLALVQYLIIRVRVVLIQQLLIGIHIAIFIFGFLFLLVQEIPFISMVLLMLLIRPILKLLSQELLNLYLHTI